MQNKQKQDKKEKSNINIEELQNKCEEYLSGWKRAMADYENFKKQSAKEKEEFAKFANLNLIIGLIPVYNNLKLSFNHLPDELKENNWIDGIRHIKKQFKQILEQNGVKEIVPVVGSDFNPEIHEAVESVDKRQIKVSNDKIKSENKIEKVINCGYELNGKVFLPAKVIVK